LPQLNRIVALRDLGLGLQQIHALTREGVDPQEMRRVLLLRRSELEASVAADVARLARVEGRVRALDEVGLSAADVVVALPAVRLAELTGVAGSFTPADITAVVRPMCARLGELLAEAGISGTGHLTCYYERLGDPEWLGDPEPDGNGVDGDRPEVERVLAHAALPLAAAVVLPPELASVLLPAVTRAATIVHHGPMAEVTASMSVLAQWVEHHGQVGVGGPRECCLSTGPDENDWVTELQQPLSTGRRGEPADQVGQ
jgi:DNA-binding transcriptional MerR regulator